MYVIGIITIFTIVKYSDHIIAKGTYIILVKILFKFSLLHPKVSHTIIAGVINKNRKLNGVRAHVINPY